MKATERKSYAFVSPRFGANIGGGAETLVRELAKRLALRGDRVEVLSTCAKDNRTWENHFPAGLTNEEGVMVRRFLVNPRNLESWLPKQISISQGLWLDLDNQLDWMAESVNSDDLYQFIADEGDNFDAIFFAPYLFGTTFWGSLIKPQKSILIPCLHDEEYAYLEIIAGMFTQVRGSLFNTLPEQQLAGKLYGQARGGEVGMGFDKLPPRILAPYFDNSFPYVLYIGKKETGKGAHLLIDYFIEAKENYSDLEDVKLVLLGDGSFSDLGRPKAQARDDIVDLAHLCEEDKQRLIQHCLVLCQPSVNESFSIVLMEAWRLGRPVLVNGGCPVTKTHVIEAGGGLYYDSLTDFAGALLALKRNPDLALDLGRSGTDYVERKYCWPEVLRRFDCVVGEILT